MHFQDKIINLFFPPKEETKYLCDVDLCQNYYKIIDTNL